jgi:hypothetical protein
LTGINRLDEKQSVISSRKPEKDEIFSEINENEEWVAI